MLRTHLKIHCNKMAEVIKNDKLLIHFFYETLSSAALTWYMNLDVNKIKKYKYLAKASMCKYKFNI